MSAFGPKPSEPTWFHAVGPRGAQLLSDASALVGATHDEGGLLREMMALCLGGGAEWALVYLADDAGGFRRACASSSRPGGPAAAAAVVAHRPDPSPPPALVQQVAATARGRLAHDLAAALAEDGLDRARFRELGEGAGILVPLHARGRVLGVLAMGGRAVEYGPPHVALGEALGRQMGLAIDNARLIAREQKARREAEAAARRIARLQNVTASLSEALTRTEAERMAVREAARAAGAFGAAMAVVTPDGRELEVVATEGEGAPWLPVRTPLDALRPLHQAVRTSQAYYLEDLSRSAPRFPDMAWRPTEHGRHKALACLPLVANARVLGGLLLTFAEPQAFPHEERAFLEAVARQAAQALERAWLFQSEQRARGEAEAAAAALRVTERRFRTLIEQFPLATQVFAADGSHVAANAAWERLTGRPRDSLEGYNLLRDPAFREPLVRELVEKTFAGGVVELPVRTRHGPDGEVSLRSLLFPVKDEDGRPREVVMVTEDVTDRLRSVRDLSESEARYRLIAENTLDLISRLSPDGTALYVSPVCRRLLGYEPEELVGKRVEGFIHPEDRLPEGVAPADLLDEHDKYTRTYRRRRKDGAYVWFEMTGHGVRDPRTRELREIVTVSRDVTDRKRNEREMELARRQVAQSEKLSALGSLVSGVAHEIRTPLAYITNHLFLIQQRLEKEAALGRDPRVRALLEDVVAYSTEALDGTDRINTLVKDLSRFIRQTANPRAPTPLHDVVAEAVRLFQATHRGGMTLEQDLHPTPPVSLDRVQVQQVVLNLLENAYDAEPNGGRARVSTRTGPQGVELVVEDWGPGIPPEVQARMFDPFFTTKREGTGLGLSIVRRIAETHGAALRCESTPGRGTRFLLVFPPSEDRKE